MADEMANRLCIQVNLNSHVKNDGNVAPSSKPNSSYGAYFDFETRSTAGALARSLVRDPRGIAPLSTHSMETLQRSQRPLQENWLQEHRVHVRGFAQHSVVERPHIADSAPRLTYHSLDWRAQSPNLISSDVPSAGTVVRSTPTFVAIKLDFSRPGRQRSRMHGRGVVEAAAKQSSWGWSVSESSVRHGSTRAAVAEHLPVVNAGEPSNDMAVSSIEAAAGRLRRDHRDDRVDDQTQVSRRLIRKRTMPAALSSFSDIAGHCQSTVLDVSPSSPALASRSRTRALFSDSRRTRRSLEADGRYRSRVKTGIDQLKEAFGLSEDASTISTLTATAAKLRQMRDSLEQLQRDVDVAQREKDLRAFIRGFKQPAHVPAVCTPDHPQFLAWCFRHLDLSLGEDIDLNITRTTSAN